MKRVSSQGPALAAALLLAAGVRTAAADASKPPAEAACSASTRCAAPAGWAAQADSRARRLTSPEGDVRVTVADVTGGSATDAAAAAWRREQPAFSRSVRLVSPQTPRNGWREAYTVDYEVGPSEGLTVRALAFRGARGWTVVIISGSNATLQKRAAAVALLTQSLHPSGFAPERLAGRTPHRLDPARIAAMSDFVATAMRELAVPGAAMALIDRGKVVFEGGFGVKDLTRREPVDAHTRFMIASNTKGMTTLLLATLVDDGRLAWDEPVARVYPAFRLGDPATTARVRVRDLVCACTGLPRHDFEAIFATRRDTPATAAFDLLARTQPTSGFGEVYQYNNLMASAAGYIAGRLLYPDLELRAAFARAMQARVFDPLGMTETTLDMDAGVAGDPALPYGHDIDGRPAAVRMDFNYVSAPYTPGGTAWSSAHDMARYVRNELMLGRLPDGRRMVSQANLLERRTPRVATGQDAYYGMGLMVSTAGGVELIHHGGSMAGYKSDWVALPGAGIGAVILTNSDDGVRLMRPFARRLLELIYDARPEADRDVAAAAARMKAEVAAERPRLTAPPAPELASRLAFRYANPDLGTIAVTRAANEVVFDFGLWRSRMASLKTGDGAIAFRTIDPADDPFTFVLDEGGATGTLTLHDQQHAYVYRAIATGAPGG